MQIENTKPKILFVDDEEYNLLVFRTSFRKLYDVVTAPSASEARELLKTNPADIIISDQRMPDMTGVEFLNSLPDDSDSVRMILTGYSDMEAVIDALNKGKISKFISKPWQKAELQKIIDEAIAHKKKHKTAAQNQSVNPTGSIAVGDTTNDVELLAELMKYKQLTEELKNQVTDSYKNVQLLSEIGQDITSTLDLDTILNAVYENVNQLMDASVFGIGIYNAENSTIDYQLAIEKGKRFKPYSRSMENKNQFPVWCIENKKEIFINDVALESGKYIKEDVIVNADNATMEDGSKSDEPHSIMYIPLLIKDNIVGLITVQSFNKNAYNQYHLNTLLNIGIYVATALENAKAYTLIERHKIEIEQKNAELEQKVNLRTEELRQQKDELEDTFSKLKLLTEIGQEITSTLNLDTILNTIYENVNQLMDASVFGIGIYNAETELIDYRLAIEKGKRYEPYTRSMEDKNQFPVWCIENKREVFINDVVKDAQHYLKDSVKINLTNASLEDGSKAEVPVSLIYIPLLFNNNPIGVLSVQSFKKYAYNQYHLDILRSLASYITTAIQNASSYSKMTEAFEQLKSAQSKLVESEKMASLGVLTAGVAHEINNPVNFITGGIESLQENYADVQELQLKLIRYHSQKGDENLWKEIEDQKQLLKLDSLLPEIDELMNSIRSGAERTAEIVRGLRNFSRLDENDMKKANVEEGLDNTLVILNNRLKNKVKITKAYGNVKPIMCYPGQLNQVFMNIIYNAADAIKDKGEIIISTKEENDNLYIQIRDNGMGMPEEIRSHIFEPFFTTKPVGKGTGLGLSIAYGIIEKHKGRIEVESTPGEGTTFSLSLPIQ